jgi:hypothetical protein
MLLSMQERQLKVYIDENLAPQLAKALDIIQDHLNNEEKKAIKVLSLTDVFYEGIKDEDWIPLIGREKGVVITQDRRIQHSRHQRELYLYYGVGIIFLKSTKTGLSFWQMFKHIVLWWDDIKQIVRKNEPPFSFRQPGHNQNFVEWHGED